MESCSKSLEVAKASFLELLSQCCNDNDRQLFLKWIVEEVNSEITAENISSTEKKAKNCWPLIQTIAAL